MTRKIKKTVFISYSHEMKRRVLELSEFIERNNLKAIVDEWDLKPGQDIGRFMERLLDEKTDFVLAVCSVAYARKIDARVGGARTEGKLLAALVNGNPSQTKVVPLLFEDKPDDETRVIPHLLAELKYINFVDPSADGLTHLLEHLRGLNPRRTRQRGRSTPTGRVTRQRLEELRSITDDPRVIEAARAVLTDPEFPRKMALSSSAGTVHNPVWDHLDGSQIVTHAARRDQPKKVHYCDIFLICRHVPGANPSLYTWFSAGEWEAQFFPYSLRNAHEAATVEQRAVRDFSRYLAPAPSHLETSSTRRFAVSVKRDERLKQDWWLYVFNFHSLVIPRGFMPVAADVKWLSLSEMDAPGTRERQVNGDALSALRKLFTADLSGLPLSPSL